MDSPDIFPPALLHGVAVLIVTLCVVVVAEHAILFTRAAEKAEISPRSRRVAPVLMLLGLALWAGWAITRVTQPVMGPDLHLLVDRPLVLLQMVPMVVVSFVVMLGSRTVRAVNAATPPSALIRLQIYRSAGLMFLWPLMAYHVLHPGFALPAGIGDALTGLAAPFVARAVERRRPGAHAWAVAWNYFGILDLIVAPAAAVLTRTTNIGLFPLVVIPLFLGPPLGILTHVYSLRNLRANNGQSPEAVRRRFAAA